jgi:membrane associated rhomboid family serine protease
MVPAPVGVQCVECVRRNRPPVAAARRLRAAAGWLSVTGLLIAVNVGVWMVGLVLGGPSALSQGGPLDGPGALDGPDVAAGEWWRLLTSGFLHLGILHLGLNMAVLFMLGPALEQALGRVRFAALYLLGLVASSLGPLLIDPGGATVGASGAIFALMGAALMGQRAVGIDPWRSGLMGLLAVNLVFTFVVSGISIGGHLGGLAGGLAGGLLLFDRRLHPALSGLACLGLAAACGVAAVWVAGHPLSLPRPL